MSTFTSSFFEWVKKPLRDSISIYWELIKIMIPVMVLVRLGVEYGVIESISSVFEPFMTLVGLPAEMGVVWTTAMFVNIYASMVTLVTLLPEAPLSVAQATVLGSMILIAHSLPIEQRIVQKAGPGFFATSLLRIVGALVYGAILSLIYKSFSALQTPVEINWLPQTDVNAGWADWAYDSAISLFSIYWIILALVFLLKILALLKITDLISRLLSPVLRWMGIGEKAVPITMIGAMLGLGYGGALIIKEAKAGTLEPKDIFLSLCFLCLFHSFIEDTLLIMAIGGHWSGILIGRFIFAVAVMVVLAQITQKIPDRFFYRVLFKKSLA